MPRRTPPDLEQRLLKALAGSPQGVPMQTLESAFQGLASRRTLLRRLTGLASQGVIEPVGTGRGLRYRLTAPQGARQAAPIREESSTDDDAIPLSTTGVRLQSMVQRPITERRPIGYDRAFLDDYRPNETPYLEEGVRQRLHRLGTTPDADHAAGTYARQILQRLMVDLSWASSRLEGNTYSLLDTERLIAHGQAAQGKDAAETQMILNHKAAIEFLVGPGEEDRLTPVTVRNLHALLSDNLLPDPAACGRLRHMEVAITGSVFIPLAVPQQVEECFRQILQTASAITDPFEQAFFLMVHLPYLQPFDDVNKRVSRLAANIPLIQHNLCPLSFVGVPQRAYTSGVLAVYELNRVELLRDVFTWAYERSCQRYGAIRQSLGEPDPFRLRHRELLRTTVRDCVRNLLPVSIASLRDHAKATGMAEEDLDAFVRLVLTELHTLNEGNFARYQLRPSELKAWAERQASLP